MRRPPPKRRPSSRATTWCWTSVRRPRRFLPMCSRVPVPSSGMVPWACSNSTPLPTAPRWWPAPSLNRPRSRSPAAAIRWRPLQSTASAMISATFPPVAVPSSSFSRVASYRRSQCLRNGPLNTNKRCAIRGRWSSGPPAAEHEGAGMTTTHTNCIDNEWTAAYDGNTVDVTDPSTGEVFAQIARSGGSEIGRAVQAARNAFNGQWGTMAPAARSRLLLRIAQALLDHADELAALEQRDTGKPTSQAKADAQAVARYFEFYAGAVDKLHGETIPFPQEYTVLTLREPHGVTGHIVPWNYPLQIFGRSVAASLAVGNACVVKPAEDAC